MSPALVLKVVLVIVALLLVVALVRSLFMGRGGRSARAERVRMPRAVAITASVLVVLGLAAALWGFGSGGLRDPLPFRITSVVLVAAGLAMLAVHRNRR